MLKREIKNYGEIRFNKTCRVACIFYCFNLDTGILHDAFLSLR